MEIQYMQAVVAWKERHQIEKGVSQEEILRLENKFNITFPKAYKEFLELTGMHFVATKLDHRFNYLEEANNNAKELLKEYKFENLIKKDFWVFGNTYGTHIFYFHFDEGDNPPIYRLSIEEHFEKPSQYTFGKIFDSFSDWVDHWIDSFEFEQQFIQ